MSDLSAGAEVGTIIAGGTAGFTASVVAIRWVWRHFVNGVIAAIRRIEDKVTSNGGSHPESVGTRVQVIEQEIADLKRILIGMRDRER